MIEIGLDVAESELARFADAMDLDLNPSNLNTEELESLNGVKCKILGAMRKGYLIIDDHGQPVYTTRRLKEPLTITFREPTGASLMAMDSKKSGQDVGKMFALMGDITQTDASTFSRMPMADLKVCQAIATLFLG